MLSNCKLTRDNLQFRRVFPNKDGDIGINMVNQTEMIAMTMRYKDSIDCTQFILVKSFDSRQNLGFSLPIKRRQFLSNIKNKSSMGCT